MTPEDRIQQPSKFVSLRLDPRGQRNLNLCVEAYSVDKLTVTDVIHKALEREARAVERQQRRNAA